MIFIKSFLLKEFQQNLINLTSLVLSVIRWNKTFLFRWNKTYHVLMLKKYCWDSKIT